MKKWLRIMGLLLMMPILNLVAQTTITTTPPLTANNGSTAITFQVSSSTGVNITGISNTFNTGSVTAEVWYRPGGVLVSGSTTPSVTAANGWILAGSASFTSNGNTTPTAIPITNLNIPVSAGSVVGVCVNGATGGTRYMTYNASLANTFTGGGATVSTGPGFGFGGSFPAPTIATRSFVGSITVMPQGPCTNPPYLGNAVASNDTVCAGTSFVLGIDTLTGGIGQTFQWQSSPDNMTWTNIAGATGAGLSTSQSASTYYRCYASCTASDTSGSVYVHVLSAITTPYTQNFDGAPASNNTTNPGLTDCWQYWESPGHPGYGYTYSSLAPNSSPNHMRFYSSSGYGDTMMIISPPIIGLDSSDKEVVFWAKSNSSSYNSPVAIGTMSDPSDPSTLDILGTVYAPQNYTEFIVPIDASSGYNGTDQYIAVICIQPSSPIISLYVDDITIQDQPACPKPSIPVLGLTTSSSQEISWSSAGTAFNLEWGPTGFTQGTGLSGTSTSNSYTMTGLAGNSEYDVYIQNNCAGAGNGISVWTGPITFKTLCVPAVAPYAENFDGLALTSPYTDLPSCWDPQTGPDYWDVTNDVVNTGHTYLPNIGDHTTGSSNYMWIDASSDITANEMVTGLIDMSGLTTPFAGFWFASNNTTNSTNHTIALDAWDGSSWVNLITESGNFSGWVEVSATVPATIPDTTRFRIYAIPDVGTTSSNYFQNDLGVDDFFVIEAPLCLSSSNINISSITNNSAVANWTPGEGSLFKVEYGPSGFVQGTGQVFSTIDSSYTMTGLTGNTDYQFYVRDSCAVGGLGLWVGPVNFTTLCDPLATPIVENFDNTPTGSTTNPSVPNCWGYWENPASSTSCYGYTYGFATPNGARHFRMYSFNAATDTLALISPGVSGLSAGNKLIKFYAKSGSTIGSTQLVVGTTPSQGDLRNATVIDTIQTDVGTTYSTEFSVYLDTASGYNGTDQYVFIMLAGVPSTYYQAYIDDISIEDIPLCGVPWNISASGITANGATIDWSTYYGTAFQIEYGPTGFIPGTGLATTVSNTTPGTAISGLSPNTFYDVYVADNCDSTNQAGPFTFKTNCLVQLSGSYTVGGTAGPTNFATLDSALSVLLGCGITGPVTLNLQGGTYVNSEIFETITGASATNTVTIVGGGMNVDTISIPAGTTIGYEFNGTSYVTFKDLTIDGSSTNRVIWFHDDANNIMLDGCRIIGSPSTSSLFNPIVASNSATSATSYGNNANDITIKNGEVYGGYYGIVMAGSGTTAKASGITIENNYLESYYYGMRFYYIEDVVVKDNVIDPTNTTSYGMYLYYVDNFEITGNEVNATYGIYLGQANAVAPATNSKLVNNMCASNTYGLYFSTASDIDIYHNSFRGNTRGAYLLGTMSNLDIRNNIFQGGTSEAIYYTGAITSIDIDYNVYYNTGTNLARWGATSYTSLTAWQTALAAQNVNSAEGDPIFLATDNLRIALGTVANNAGDNTVGILVDIDGNVRPNSGSTTVDIGAYEYTPVTSDIGLISGMLEKGMCLTQNDTVILEIENVLGSTLNFATDSVVAKWDVSGPANSNGTITLNSGTLAVGATVTMMATTVDLSIPGVYTFNAYLEPSSYNLSVLNDTLEQSTFTVYPVWEVTPVSDTLYVVTDTAELEVKSPFLSGGDFFISEVCQYKYSVGAPTGGWPSYLIADDYIEITGVPGSDLAGITLEQWSTSAIMSTFTFLPGTLIGPNGTAIIAVGQMGSSTPSPTNYYYHGNGAYTGSFGSSGSNGRILKDANGVIMDAVGYGSSYTFPTISGVTSAEWTSTLAASTTTSGIRLQGADVNNSSTWVQSSTSPQDPNTVNSMVQVPSAGSTAGFSWSQVINGALVQVDTLPAIKVGATSPGIFYYVASFTNACGTFTDTVTIYSFIAGCPAPTNFAATAGCKDVTLTWTSDAGTTDSYIEYGATGYTFGSGTPVVSASSPQVISGLTPNTGYDFYLVDSCAGGFTVPIMLSETTTSNPTVATFTWMQSATTMSNADVDFDASATVNGTTYTWDFGDASPAGTGVSPTHQYMSNGVYYATVTVDGPCDTDIYGDTVLVAGISIEESLLNTSLNVFPNPSNGNFRVEFQVEGLKNVTLRVSTLLGQEIYMSQPGNVSGEYREEIDLSNEATGVYVLQIITDENVVSRRITIRK